MKILTVDDDKNILTVLDMILKGHDFDVDSATSAEEALEIVKKNEYDFILIDLKMPEHDGLWFMKHAQLPRKTKVLLLTAFLTKEAVNKMFQFGISGYLTKPFDEEEIIRHLEFHGKSANSEPLKN